MHAFRHLTLVHSVPRVEGSAAVDRHMVGMDQIVGLQQIVGQAVSDAITSAFRRPGGGSAGPREVPMAGNGPREFPMGFGLTAIAAGAQQIVNANPQVNFRPSRLVIPDSVASSFMVNDFKIGMRSQLVAPGALPATSFTEKAVGTAMSLDTVNVGQFVTLDISNVSTQAANFTASLFGTTLNS